MALAVCSLLVASLAMLSSASTVTQERAELPIVTARKALNVNFFPVGDYPANFAIIAGVVITLVLAIVLYIAAVLSKLDPGKDSILYRLTTTREKKD